MRTHVYTYSPEENTKHAEKLWADFCKHREEIMKADPNKDDEMQVFKGWALQKLANLEILTLALTMATEELSSKVERLETK